MHNLTNDILWKCKYNIAFAPKYKYETVFNDLKCEIYEMIKLLCGQKGVRFIKAEIQTVYVYIAVEISPELSVADFISALKKRSSIMILGRLSTKKHKRPVNSFWCNGYYVDTMEANQEKMNEFIWYQIKDDCKSIN
jgi:putative transposase